jgi:hypothetical protein
MRPLAHSLACLMIGAVLAAAPRSARSQSSKLRVIATDSTPVAFAWVSIQGGAGVITDERGEVTLGQMRRKTLSAEVRRIGYSPWMGKLELPDSAVVITVQLSRLVQSLTAVTVTGQSDAARNLPLRAFYDRWMDRQKGVLSATFIGPEEIEKRHPSRPSDLLYGLLGVTLSRTPRGGMVAKGGGGTCYMTVLLDGQRLCPPAGCHTSDATSGNAAQLGRRIPEPGSAKDTIVDDVVVDLNQYINANEIAGIEVYARGGNMPVSLQVSDNACGVIAIWTGARR